MSRLGLLVLLSACTGRETPRDAGADTRPDGSETDAGEWGGPVDVVVVDGAGAPVEGAFALVGGRPEEEWATTDSLGRATVLVRPDPFSDRWITAGKRGWYSSGAALPEEAPPDGPIPVTILPLPDADNPDYVYGEGGTVAGSGTAAECLHC